VTDDQLIYEQALRDRQLKRTLSGTALVLSGLLTACAACLPQLAKSALPLYWVDHANRNGWDDRLHSIGIKILADARIQVVPDWFSYALLVAGGVTAWLGVHMIRSRTSPALFGELFTRSYWRSFYLWGKPKAVRVSYRPVIRTPKDKNPG
jgi:hypothetical protein